ncbi:MAG TPA: cytochrome c3 family protein [Thermodesulfobacteriota bacterium]
MKNKFILIIILIFLAFYGCRKQERDIEWGWKQDKPVTPQKHFSHKLHENVLSEEGLDCEACHPVGFVIEEKEEEKRAEISGKSLIPGKETCHFCHFNPQAGSIAPNSCDTCHVDMRGITPANHNFNWSVKHAVFAKADANSCNTCHSPRFCEDCHKRRDLPTLRVHDRNFRFIHGIEARANPRECGNCHELKSFCDQCHIRGGYDR